MLMIANLRLSYEPRSVWRSDRLQSRQRWALAYAWFSGIAITQRDCRLGECHGSGLHFVCDSHSQRQPHYAADHSTPSQDADDRGDLGVIVENAEIGEDAEEIVLCQIGVAGGDQREQLSAGVGHVFGGVDPVFEKEEQAEDEAGQLAFAEEISCQKKRDKPLQQRPTPQAEGGAEPTEQVMSAFVDHQIGAMNKERCGGFAEGVEEKADIKNEPCGERRPGYGLPRFVNN